MKQQWIDEEDIQAVVDVLKSDWLTTGPKVEEFEQKFAEFVGSKYAVAVSSGTAALHAAMFAIRIQPEDEVIVPAITFIATANAVVYQGGTPVFADVKEDTLLIDPEDIKITSKTKAIIAVDYAGQPCNYTSLKNIAEELVIVADACHAVGGKYKDKNVGSLAELNTFSFHPVKNMTTGEGGMITTDSPVYADAMRSFRDHGRYNGIIMGGLGYNYRMTDIQAALGISQLKKLPEFIKRRQEIAKIYDEAFKDNELIRPLKTRNDVSHARHLYVVCARNRNKLFDKLKEAGIYVNIHYDPVYFHEYYWEDKNFKRCFVAETASTAILSLPIYPKMTDEEVDRVITPLNFN